MTIKADHIIHKNRNRIKLRFFRGNDQVNPQMLPSEINQRVRKIKGCYISKNLAAWNFPYRSNARQFLQQIFPNQTIIYNTPESSEEQLPPVAPPVAHTTPENQNTEHPEKSKNETPANSGNVQQVTIRIDKENNRFFVDYRGYNPTLWAELRKIENGFWQKEQRQWIFKGTNDTYKTVYSVVKQNGYRIEKQTEPTMLEKETNPTVRAFIESLQMKNYSVNTIDAYLPHFKQFVNQFALQKPEELGYRQINQYITETIQSNKFGDTQTRHLISAIKFFYEKMLGKQKMYFNQPQKYEITNHTIFVSPDELIPILKKIEDSREASLIILNLGYGKTPEQIASLTLQDIKTLINRELQQQTHLAQLLKQTVVKYYKINTPTTFLFETNASEQITATEIEAILYKILQKHQITKLYVLQYEATAKQANFEYHTTKNYISLFLSFLKHFAYRHPNQITDNEIKQYLLVCKNERKLSTSYINNLINSIKFYYTHIAKRKIDYRYLMRPKREKKLPTVLSTNEVLRMIAQTENIKHKNMIALLYASGLRRSELLNMKIKDIDFERNVVIVRGGKGKKDRQTPLAQNLLGVFKQYIDAHQPKDYLFEGATGGRYSERSLERVVKNAAENAKIVKHVSPHAMRHSFATHLLENAVDIRYIQQLLGHSNIKTTERYTHVANVAHTTVLSPLDKLTLSETDKPKEPP